MNGLLLIIGLPLAGWGLYFGWRWLQQSRRDRLAQEGLPAEFVATIERQVPLYRRLPRDLQEQLLGHVNVFLHDKSFFGCDGLEITDEMRLTVAGNACLLLLNRGANHFDGFQTILVYPDTFVTTKKSYDGMVESSKRAALAGESWHAGPLILSWKDVLRGIADPDDGHNVVLHEFAHKLDEENGIVDGLPVLREPADYREWARVLTEEFKGLEYRVAHRRNKVMDAYGATSPPEFFAVATESFFERGALMQRELPALYEQLQKYYGVDPASWGKS